MGRELSRLRVARLMLVRSAAAAGLLVLMHVPLQAACALQLPEARFEAAVSVSREKGMSGGAGRGPWTAPHKGSVLRHATTARPARNLGVSVFLNTPRFHRRCIRLSMSSPGAGSEGGKARTESREETGEIALTELRESGESGIPTREVSLSGFLSGLPFGLNRWDSPSERARERRKSWVPFSLFGIIVRLPKSLLAYGMLARITVLYICVSLFFPAIHVFVLPTLLAARIFKIEQDRIIKEGFTKRRRAGKLPLL